MPNNVPWIRSKGKKQANISTTKKEHLTRKQLDKPPRPAGSNTAAVAAGDLYMDKRTIVWEKVGLL